MFNSNPPNNFRIIVKRRRNHEYKMVRRPARLEDFLAAIQFELHLDSLRKHRKRVHITLTLKNLICILAFIHNSRNLAWPLPDMMLSAAYRTDYMCFFG